VKIRKIHPVLTTDPSRYDDLETDRTPTKKWKQIMSFTTFSGPVRSLAGFVEPVTYIFATDVDAGAVNISATGNYIVLSAADGGPTGNVDLILPQVESGAFSLAYGQNQPADARYNGAKGSVYNYGSFTVVVKGYDGQLVNGASAGVDCATGTAVQWGGNGNQAAPWGAIISSFAPND